MTWLREGWESTEPFVELEDLRERGLVRVEQHEVLPCDSFEQITRGMYCGGWAEVGDAEAEAVACGICGRLLEHDEAQKRYVLHVDQEGITRALDDALDGRRLREGVAWSVEGEQDHVLVVVADWSDGTRWMSNRTLLGRPFVLIQVDEVVTASRLGSANWVVTASLLEVLRDPSVLQEAIRRALELAEAPRDEEAIIELQRLRSRVVYEIHGAHLVELAETEIRIDDVVVKVPAGMRTVVAFLIDRHVEDVRDGKAPEAFCAWSLEEMSEALGLPRTTVHKQLRRFQERLRDRYAAEVRRPLGAVLELEGAAWRFSPDCLVRRVA